MNNITNIWASSKFRFLAIPLRYQPVPSKQRVMETFYSHVRVCERITNKNYQTFSGRKLMPTSDSLEELAASIFSVQEVQ
jgi:hypothetical protein